MAEARTAAARPTRRPSRRVASGLRVPRAPLPGDVKALLAGVAMVAAIGLGWLIFGPAPPPIVPVLGYMDAGPPTAPTPTPAPTPPFKLPWWM